MSRADAILTELRANPELALAVVEALEVATPWEAGTRPDGSPRDDWWFRLAARRHVTYAAHAQRRKDGRWDWWHLGKVEHWPGQHGDYVASAEEAMRRADAGLDAAGVPRL